jgi:hypothetical protein
VSQAGNARLLRRLEQKHGKKHNPFLEMVFSIDREERERRRAALALAEVAQILAGTDKMKAARFSVSSAGGPMETEPRVDHPPPRSHRRVWSETVRPGPHDVLTWDEVRQVPWIEGSAHEQ